jgi:hypothetical protein
VRHIQLIYPIFLQGITAAKSHPEQAPEEPAATKGPTAVVGVNPTAPVEPTSPEAPTPPEEAHKEPVACPPHARIKILPPKLPRQSGEDEDEMEVEGPVKVSITIFIASPPTVLKDL